MLKKMIDLQPQPVWKHFYNLTQIPRPSGREAAVVEYIKKIAIRKNLEYSIDEVGNILVRKPDQTDRKEAKKLILQSHVDMVPQKNSDKHHDFARDPINAIIDGEWIRADKTTLGADNGIGVASMLAILESDDINHGPIEALFTVSEETGMDGAFGLKPSLLQGEILLNLDSEDERELIIGCAGGLDASIRWEYNVEKPLNGKAFLIEVKGLKGGHSGIDINLGRANANKLIVQLLILLQDSCGAHLCSLKGGNLRNAIPREAEAVIFVPVDKTDQLIKIVNEYHVGIVKEYKDIETDLAISLREHEKVAGIMPMDEQKKSLKALNDCPNGVINISPAMKEVVQTSTNLAIVRVGDGKCEAQCLLRSSNDLEKSELAKKMKEVFSAIGARSFFEGDYPGWNPDTGSFILAKAINTYKKVFGTGPEVKVIHAGLECGIIGGAYPDLDMISFGPTIRHPHSPDEKVNIASVERFWIFLKSILEDI
jgi:dipeptidase D